MYMMKNDGASRILGKTVLQDTLSVDLVAEEYPKVSLANKAGDDHRLIDVRHLMAFDNFIMSPSCHAVSYAALRSISTAPVLSVF